MKIGILTFWTGQDNYGQILQCYALQAYLKQQGHEAFLVRYAPKAVGLQAKLKRAVSPGTLLAYLKTRRSVRRAETFRKAHPRHFSDFLKEHIASSSELYRSLDELRTAPPEADAYIVGSDQVWNRSIGLNDFGRGWFLDFGAPATKRFSYAASFGMKELPEDYRRFFSPLLAKFDAVSVREQEGTDFCRKMGRSDAVLVCDPTLLLRKEDYCALIPDNAGTQEKKPLLCYMLGHACAFPKDVLDAFVAEKGLELHYVPSQGAENLDYYAKVETPTVQGWLRLYRDAEYVVTNSFHGTVFAILMQKKFLALPLSGKSSGMNGRLESLLTELDLRERLLTGSGNDFRRVMDAPIDWESVSARAEILRKQGKEFLKQL